ncbi:putative GDP-fucose synthetase [Magnetofaba australis IT-1]|uniref:Putative GDP-fucose synthetase n=1 Tax=Magnetofaba australis IT-1 TaxID=1434232 RepID=A0A1Y2K1W3_9PROT|nr:putative GDP-fucose synthetase [Magnetofaba australis IT-1]
MQADLTRADDVNRVVQGMDVIIQAAATTSGAKDIVTQPHIHVTDNAVMNSLLLRAAHDHHVGRFVFFSCSVMYPSADHALKESDYDPATPPHPKYFGVGLTKVYIENMCEFYARLGRTRFTVIRHSNIYGPYDKYDLERSHVFGATVAKVMQDVSGRITVWGAGREARDLLYVDDLTEFVERALARQQTPYTLVNVGYGRAISIRELVEKIIAAAGKRIAIDFDLDKPNIDTRVFLDIRRAEELYGWRPTTSLESGIRKTLDWYRAQLPQQPADSV